MRLRETLRCSPLIAAAGSLFVGCPAGEPEGVPDAAPSQSPSSISSGTPTTVASGGETCTPGFTPYSPEAGRCSAHHTVCKKGPDGDLCHGGAIMIECGEWGERCGQRFFCDCGGDAGRRAPATPAH